MDSNRDQYLESQVLLSEIPFQDRELVVHTLKQKQIYTLYDLIALLSYFKITKCNPSGTNGIENYKNTQEYEEDVEENEEREEEDKGEKQDKKCCDYKELRIKNSHNNIMNHTDENRMINDHFVESRNENSNSLTKKNISGTLQKSNKKVRTADILNSKKRKSEHKYCQVYNANGKNTQNNDLISYFEKVREEYKHNSNESYFDVFIQEELIEEWNWKPKDIELLISYIWKTIETNDIHVMCIYLNLKHLTPKLEALQVKSIQELKMKLNSLHIQEIQKALQTSYHEILILLHFLGKVKKKRCFCTKFGNDIRKSHYKMKNSRIICDKIHQFIKFDDWIFKNIIDNHYFQRMRNISQLGVCHYVYPGATHSRFEHSLGVGHLASQYFTLLSNESNMSPYHGELFRMFRCVQIAGLCHDLGHGPYSHTFESCFINYNKTKLDHMWNHANMSLLIAEHILENLVDQDEMLDSSDIKTVKKLICGRDHFKHTVAVDPIDSLIDASFDIVCNNLNGLDADKFDYLQRDATIAPNNGTLPSFNPTRLMNHSKVINGNIGYNESEVFTVWTAYVNRFALFKKVYTHRKVRAMELMLCDAFRLTDHIFKWRDALEDLETFVELTDQCVIFNMKEKAKTIKNNQSLNHALKLVNSVICDRHGEYAYKFIDEYIITDPRVVNDIKSVGNVERISQYARGLSPDDIVVDWNTVDYGKGSKDPLDYVYFHKRNEGNQLSTANKQVRRSNATYFEEHNIRLYCKNQKVGHLAKEAFKNFIMSDIIPKLEQV